MEREEIIYISGRELERITPDKTGGNALTIADGVVRGSSRMTKLSLSSIQMK